ncbi:hypothetical protein Ndes2526B_g03648 [Nannochloris sp. 'desiccata']
MGEQQIYFHILPGDETQLHPEPGISAPLRQKAIFRVALTLFNRLEFKSWKFNFCSLNLTLRAIQIVASIRQFKNPRNRASFIFDLTR